MSIAAALGLVAAGIAALVLRPVGNVAIVTTGLVGVAGALAAGVRDRKTLGNVTTVVVGLAAVLGARAMGSPIPIAATAIGVLSLVVAGVAEEAFFRGAFYRALSGRAGPIVAVAITTIAFAAIHVPTYGPGVLGVDLAAGLVLGWQRWVSGTWVVPAITHVVANLMQLG